MNRSFWNGKRVLVTGHTGFKGSWLSLWLTLMGADVVGYALRPPTSPNLFDLIRLGEMVRSIEGDVRNADQFQSAVCESKPEIVFHLAAQSLVRESYTDPIGTYATNVMGTVHLLNAVRNCPSVRAVVNVTSDKCYENREWVWSYREIDSMGGFDPYSSSKGCAELVTSAFRNSFFRQNLSEPTIGLASARAGNVIGGGDWSADRLVPDIMRAFLSGRSAMIRNPRSVRPWQHVLDALSGYLLLAERLWTRPAEYSEGWNFGPAQQDTVTVEFVVNGLVERWGDGASWQCTDASHLHEAFTLSLDCSKAMRKLGWRPMFTLREALDLVNSWFKSYQRQEDMRSVTQSQIFRYTGSQAAAVGRV